MQLLVAPPRPGAGTQPMARPWPGSGFGGQVKICYDTVNVQRIFRTIKNHPFLEWDPLVEIVAYPMVPLSSYLEAPDSIFIQHPKHEWGGGRRSSRLSPERLWISVQSYLYKKTIPHVGLDIVVRKVAEKQHVQQMCSKNSPNRMVEATP